MKYAPCLAVFVLMAGIGVSDYAWAQPAAGKQGGELRKDTRDTLKERRELRKDMHETLQDRREARDDKHDTMRESLEDRKEARENIRAKIAKMREMCKGGERKACEELRRHEMMARRQHERNAHPVMKNASDRPGRRAEDAAPDQVEQ